MNRKEKISYIQRCITDKKINHNYIKTFIEIHEIKVYRKYEWFIC